MVSSGAGLKSAFKSSLMTKLLSNPKIAMTALNFVKGNQKVLNTVMGLIGVK